MPYLHWRRNSTVFIKIEICGQSTFNQGVDMEGHVNVVGYLCVGLSILAILIGAFTFVLLAGIGFVAHDEEASFILPTIGFVVALFFCLISVPGIIGGIGLFKRRECARILVLIISALQLINFPIGTAIGAYSIWVLVQQDSIRLFNPIVPPPPAQG